MKEILNVVNISRQALNQHFRKEQIFSHRVEELLVMVDTLREEHPGCGLEKMYFTIRPDWIGRDQFVALLMDLGYRVRYFKNYIRTTIPACYSYVNCIEGMILWDKNQLWQSDITYFKVKSEYYYIVFILDVYTKQIIGYQASDHMRATANLKALKNALKSNGVNLTGLIHHSDRGSQYGESAYVAKLESCGITISMGDKATDNAYAERVNGIIKNEFLKHWDINSLGDLKRSVRKAVEYYNSKRIHLSLPHKMTPNGYAEMISTEPINLRVKVTVFSEKNYQLNRAPERFGFDIKNFSKTPMCLINN